MIQQTNNTNIRKNQNIHLEEADVDFLTEYFDKYRTYPLFQQVLIETRTDCNNNCPFCPHHYNEKPLGIMAWETYKLIIEDLIKIGFSGRVALMVSNEPLLEDRLIEMIDFAKSKSPRLFLDITTNGKLLTLDYVDALFSHGLDNLNVNDYRGDRSIYPDKVSSNLIPIFEAYKYNPKLTLQKRSFAEILPNYGGNIPQNPTSDSATYFCNFPFRKLVIDYSGNVILCCNDFLSVTNMGNIHEKSLIECWNSPQFNQYRDSLVAMKRTGLCSKCNDGQDYNAFV